MRRVERVASLPGGDVTTRLEAMRALTFPLARTGFELFFDGFFVGLFGVTLVRRLADLVAIIPPIFGSKVLIMRKAGPVLQVWCEMNGGTP